MPAGTLSLIIGRLELTHGRALAAHGKAADAHAAFAAAVHQLDGTVGPDHPDTKAARQLANETKLP